MTAKELINNCYKTGVEYTHLKRINESSFPIANACPINLKIVEKKDSNNVFEKIVKIKNVVQEDCKRVVIFAKAGCGKTTFCKQYAHLSQNSTDFSFKGQVIHIPLRRLKIYHKQSKVYNLIDVFENEFFSQELKPRRLAEELYLDYRDNKDKYLFLLDGLDEIDQDIIRNESHSMHKCLMDLLKSSAEHYLIVTTRPYVSLKDYKFSMQLEIKGLYDSDVKKYINTFAHKDRKKILAYKKANYKVANSLMCTPIFLDVICICFEEELFEIRVKGDDFKLTIANLLKIVIEILWRKYLSKEGIVWYKEKMNSEALNSKMEKEIEFLEKLAFDQSTKNSIQFSMEDLNNKNLIKSYIFQFEMVRKGKQFYSFANLYFQNYYTAKYIIRNIEEQDIIDFIRINKYDERFQHVWPFVGGIADINCANKLLDLLEQHPRDLCGGEVHQRLILACLNETVLPFSREERLSEEFVNHLKFFYDTKFVEDTKLHFIKEFFATLPYKVLDKLLDWDNWGNPSFHEFSIYVLGKFDILPCSYLLKLLEIYEKSYKTKNQKNLETCKNIIRFRKNIPNLVFVKINKNLKNPEMWLEFLDCLNTIPDKTLKVISSIILEKIQEAVELDFKIESGTTDENESVLDNYLINLKSIISKSVNVFNLHIIPDSVKEEISKCINASSVFIDIQELLKSINIESEVKSETDSGKEIGLDKLFEEKNEFTKEEILHKYQNRKDLQKNHIEILKQWIKSSEISYENRIRAVLCLWDQDYIPCDLMIHEEAISLFIYKGENSFLFDKNDKYWELVNKCRRILREKFYKMAENQRDGILEEMYKFLANHNNFYYDYDYKWVTFLAETLTLEDFQKAILYLFEHKIPIKSGYDIGKFVNKAVPIDLIGKLVAIFNDNFEIINATPNLQQVFHELLHIIEYNFKFFSTVSKPNFSLLQHICHNYKMSDDVITRILQCSILMFKKTEIKNYIGQIDYLDWFLNYLQQINDEDEQKLSKMFTNVIFISWNGYSVRWESIKINSALKINKTEPNFLEPLENLLKKCQKLFPNCHNDLSIYFRFHSLHDRSAYVQKAIDSCSNFKLKFGENSFLVYKNAILGFLKIEIVSNIKFCIDDFKSLLEKELNNFELVHLDLSNNKLTDKDLFLIVPIVKKHNKLESLILSHNEITHTGFLDLLHDIKYKMHSLKCLFLDYNQIMLSHDNIEGIPQEISNILERVDLSMNFISKDILEKLTASQFPIYKSYYNDTQASIFPVKQREWRKEFEGSIALFYKNQWMPSHVFLIKDQINKEIGQRTITKVELTVYSNGEVNISETIIKSPVDFLIYIEKLSKKEYICRYALLTKEKFDKLFNKITDLSSSQNLIDYSLFPYFFGDNCVTFMVKILKEIDIHTNFVISPMRITFSWSTYKYLLIAVVILIISLVVNYFL